MITTADGVRKKRGDIVWEIAYSSDRGLYLPIRSIVHRTLQNENTAYSTRKLCQNKCDEWNINSKEW